MKSADRRESLGGLRFSPNTGYTMMFVMHSKWRKPTLSGCVALLCIALQSTASAQSYLDQLESIVKKFGEEKASEPVTEELPRPNSSANSSSLVPVPAKQTPADADDSAPIYLGLEAEDVTGGGLGVLVTKVTAKSPAWKAGFEVGDRILAVNNFSISGLDQMADRLFRLSPGDTCQFLVTRGARNIKLTAVLLDAQLASKTLGVTPPTATQQMDTPEPAGKAWVGLLVNDLTAAFRAQFGQRVSRGAAVTSVTRGSPAWDAGIRAGDCITEFAQQPISSAEDMISMLGVLKPGQLVEVIYYRGVIRRNANLTLTTQPGTASAPQRAPRIPVNPNVANRPAGSGQQANGGANVQRPPLADSSGRGAGIELPPFLQPNEPRPNGSASPTTPPQEPAAKKDAVDAQVAQLQETVKELQRELAAKNKQIEDMQQRLQAILQSLGGGR
ncbi:MAG: hypothetical protein Aurels2KO_47370 [Aureliella sp.]